MIVGGSEAAITPGTIGGFGAAQALSKNNVSSASQPFDVNRTGFVAGEGAGALILEDYEYAVQRGATILAEIVGGGMAADAYHLTGTSPDGLGQNWECSMQKMQDSPLKILTISMRMRPQQV
jgi:3-oxoacyl-[acyl-carrier-protein] synthase II